MRSPKELSFRLRQEIANVVLLSSSPRRNLNAVVPLEDLPSPHAIADAVRGTAYADALVQLADRVLAGYIPIFGKEIAYGTAIAWQRDPLRNVDPPRKYLRFVPYLDSNAVGDHKWIWELNRHQHLVLLAQAFAVTKNDAYADEVLRQLQHWWNDNPFQRGINWTSALEVGFRALSWTWIWHLLGDRMPAEFRRPFLAELYRHGLHLEYNLSSYFSPNTHLLGEAVALHALGRLFPEFPRASRWRREGRDVVRTQMRTQVRADGSHFEQSTYYHVYALDMFLLHAVLEEIPDEYRDGLERMTNFLASVVNANGDLPFLGDDDGGRLFHPYGERARFARGTLATASVMLDGAPAASRKLDTAEVALWWLGPEKCRAPTLSPKDGDKGGAPDESMRGDAPLSSPGFGDRVGSRVFSDSGLVLFRRGDVSAVFDAGPFGPWSAGHSHADALSLVISRGGDEALIDPGTFTYMDAEWRDAFRGTAAHNTVRIDGSDQALSAGPFRWMDKPEVQLLDFSTSPGEDRAIAVCRYRGFTHKRTITFRNGSEFDILDEVEGPPGEHLIEQFWHVGGDVRQVTPTVWQIGQMAELAVEGAESEPGLRSRVFGSKEETAVVVVRRKMALSATLRARVKLIG